MRGPADADTEGGRYLTAIADKIDDACPDKATFVLERDSPVWRRKGE